MEATRKKRRMDFWDGDDYTKGEGEVVGSDEHPADENESWMEEDKKSIYAVMVRYPSYDLRLTRINPHDTSSSSGFQDITPKSHPPDFNDLWCYTVAALEPNLYFIGGYYRQKDGPTVGGRCSDKVLVFNTRTEAWDEPIAPMNIRRAFPAVLVYDQKIYVFGFNSAVHRYDGDIREKFPVEKWAEVYDTVSKKWEFLDAVNEPPVALLNPCSLPLTAAVCEEQQRILFCLRGVGVYGYRFDSRSWFTVTRFEPGPDILWSEAIAVRKSLLFWLHGLTIGVCDLRLDSPPSQLFTLDASYLDNYSGPGPSFLVNAGNRVLGLLYMCSSTQGQQLAFHRFELQHEDVPSLHAPECHTTLPAEDTWLVNVLAM